MNEARKIMIQNYCHLLDVRNELSEKGILTYRDLEALGHSGNNDTSSEAG